MEKTWKGFKIDKNKVYQRIGQAVVYSSIYVGSVWLICWGFIQNTVY